MIALRWAVPAFQDRQWIFEYIAERDVEAAIRLDSRISALAEALLQQPNMGRPGRVTGTRELLVQENYLLVYEATLTTVTVLRVLHARQQWPT